MTANAYVLTITLKSMNERRPGGKNTPETKSEQPEVCYFWGDPNDPNDAPAKEARQQGWIDEAGVVTPLGKERMVADQSKLLEGNRPRFFKATGKGEPRKPVVDKHGLPMLAPEKKPKRQPEAKVTVSDLLALYGFNEQSRHSWQRRGGVMELALFDEGGKKIIEFKGNGDAILVAVKEYFADKKTKDRD